MKPAAEPNDSAELNVESPGPKKMTPERVAQIKRNIPSLGPAQEYSPTFVLECLSHIDALAAESQRLQTALDGDLFHRCEECGGEQQEDEDGWYCPLCKAKAEIVEWMDRSERQAASIADYTRTVCTLRKSIDAQAAEIQHLTGDMGAAEMEACRNHVDALDTELDEARAEIRRLKDRESQPKKIGKETDFGYICSAIGDLEAAVGTLQEAHAGHGWGWAYAALRVGRHVRRPCFAPGNWLGFLKSTIWLCVGGGKQVSTRSMWVMRDEDLEATDWVLAGKEATE